MDRKDVYSVKAVVYNRTEITAGNAKLPVCAVGVVISNNSWKFATSVVVMDAVEYVLMVTIALDAMAAANV
ncbi:MAG: hypothetical protein IJD43_13910 [Thermoguttaceae bacterium]|nr:hypothetical protein [Thermoguttaceae bacterium]